MRPDKARLMLVASFYADSYALPFQFQAYRSIADPSQAAHRQLQSPHTNPYHRDKRTGDLTHIGDQSLLMYQLLQRESGFTVEVARKQWCQYMRGYSGFMDVASATALRTFRTYPHALKGSDSDSLAGAARIAPFVYFIDDLAALLIAVEAQTRLTHSHPDVVASALFLTKLAYRVKHGQSVIAGIEAEAAALPSTSPLAPLIDKAQQHSSLSTPAAISALGNDSSVASAFASTMVLLFRYQSDYWGALYNNIVAGGDSATRGALSGIVLGASLTSLAPEFQTLRCYSCIMEGAPLIRAH